MRNPADETITRADVPVGKWQPWWTLPIAGIAAALGAFFLIWGITDIDGSDRPESLDSLGSMTGPLTLIFGLVPLVLAVIYFFKGTRGGFTRLLLASIPMAVLGLWALLGSR